MSGAIIPGAEVTSPRELSCDVCVIGSGAGGAVLAAGLVERGLSVVMLEEGGHRTKKDFTLHEGDAYPMLYQERLLRATADASISILQGRTVGGSTTVNWTTCFRTPDRILEVWRTRHGLEHFTAEELRPHFEAVEERLHIHEWDEQLVNANNKVLLDGARKLGWEAKALRRNVYACRNSGFCGVGCPVDAKQSMLVTYVPDAVAKGMTLHADTQAMRLVVEGGKVVAVEAEVLDPATQLPKGVRITVKPKVCVASGGAINTPALLLRSQLNENGRVGKRTWLHPVVAMGAMFDHEINGWYGAPQSVGSHQFIDRGADKVGYFLETPPVHPLLASTAYPQFGRVHQELMASLKHVNTLLSIGVDGLVAGDEGGTVSLRPDGRVRVDYAIGPAMAEAFRDGMKTMARIQLAAGARKVVSFHVDAVVIEREADVAKLDHARYGNLEHSIFTAHQMGGAVMGKDPATSVVDGSFRHHRIPNLFVVDGSALPTALGVNPSETIYGLAHWARERVAAAV